MDYQAQPQGDVRRRRVAHLLPDRRSAARRLRLIADVVLTRGERLWVEMAGGRQLRRELRDVDPATGRTSLEHLRRLGTGDVIWPKVEAALERGVAPEKVAAALDSVTDDAGERLVSELKSRSPQMLRDHRAIHRGMQRRMRAIWGPAFDAFYEVYVCVEELGSDLQQLHAGENDALVAALLGLHARGCLVLAEVHALMVAGFPFGAWARTRSLYETAVIATLLGTRGREHGNEDLGERFMLHAAVDRARDLEVASHSGANVDDAELQDVRSQLTALVARFGPMFAKDYGWARPLFPSVGPRERVTFARLEELADSGLDRLDYRLGGHHVHSSAWTVALNELPRRGKIYRLTGSTNIGFGDPASVALAATLILTSAIVHGIGPAPEPMHLVGLRALQSLSMRTLELFAESQAIVDQREERLQARLDR